MTRSRGRTSTFFLLLALGGTCATLASPEVAQAQATDDTERARVLFQEGNAAYRERNWQLAYEKFHEAFGLAPTYDLAGNLGDVELMLEKPRDAAEHLAYSLKNWPAGQAEARAKTEARLKEAKGLVATIKVSVNKDGAEVFVNGVSVGTSPISGELFVNPGAITVEAKSGGKSDKSTIALDKGGVRAVTLTLGEGGPGAPQGPNDGGVNGQSVSTTGMKPKTIALIVGGGLTLVAVGGWFFFNQRASSADDDVTDLKDELSQQFGNNACGGSAPPSKCGELSDAVDKRDSSRALATVSLVAGGVLLAGTVATYFLWPDEPKTKGQVRPSRPRAYATPTRSGVALGLVGEF